MEDGRFTPQSEHTLSPLGAVDREDGGARLRSEERNHQSRKPTTTETEAGAKPSRSAISTRNSPNYASWGHTLAWGVLSAQLSRMDCRACPVHPKRLRVWGLELRIERH